MRAHLAVLVLAAACGSKQPLTSAPSNTSAAPAPAKPAVSRDPYDVKMWAAKLSDPREAERAVTELEQLGDPAAIAPLGEAWLAQGRPARILQVIVGLARPLTAAEAKARFVTAFETSGRPASWAAAAPYLRRAVAEIDEANPRSVDSAIKAADALADAQLGLDEVIALAQRAPTKKLIAAEVAAIRSMGRFAAERETAAGALVKNLERDLPPHPRTARDPAEGRQLEESYGLYLAVTGASINALAELRPASAAKPLVLAMYRTPELFTQVRRALVASGPAAGAELQKVLRGEHGDVEKLFRDKKLDKYCGDNGDEACQPVSAKTFYAAVVLGDLRDPAAVPELLAALKSAPAPAYYFDDMPGPTTQYAAVFDALRKIGSPAAAVAVRGMWLGAGKKVDVATRASAISAYPFVTRDPIGVAELGKVTVDMKEDDAVRTEAAMALARLSSDVKDIALLTNLAKKYVEASAKKAQEAAKLQKTVAAADAELDAAKQTMDAAKANALAVTHDTSTTIDQIKAATAAAKKADDAFKAAKKKHKERVAPFKAAEGAAKAYTGYARMFQAHVAAIEIAARCKADVACFAAAFTAKDEDVVAANAKYLPDVGTWTRDETHELQVAAIDRALVEIGKRGDAAADQTDAVLAAVGGPDRGVRAGALLALPLIAKRPCPRCVAKLDEVIRAGEGDTIRADQHLETQVLRNYFASAGE